MCEDSDVRKKDSMSYLITATELTPTRIEALRTKAKEAALKRARDLGMVNSMDGLAFGTGREFCPAS